MKEFTTSKGKFLLIQKDEYGKLLHPKDCEYIELGRASELTEEQAKEVVDLYPDCIKHYEDYHTYAYPKNEALFSFQTLLKSLSIKNTTDLYLFKILGNENNTRNNRRGLSKN